MFQKCCSCEQEKPITDFKKSILQKTKKVFYQKTCKLCQEKMARNSIDSILYQVAGIDQFIEKEKERNEYALKCLAKNKSVLMDAVLGVMKDMGLHKIALPNGIVELVQGKLTINHLPKDIQRFTSFN